MISLSKGGEAFVSDIVGVTIKLEAVFTKELRVDF